jgi:enamine deaminase RidA (YjgF/YER057c/UK114 family)
VVRIVKVVGFVSSDPAFTGQPGVINGASEVLAEIFGEAGRHARSAVGVAVLPLDSPVEVELVLEFADPLVEPAAHRPPARPTSTAPESTA